MCLMCFSFLCLYIDFVHFLLVYCELLPVWIYRVFIILLGFGL